MRRALAGLGIVCALAGCGSDDDDGGGPAPKPFVPATSQVLFGPAAESELTPFPSDRYTTSDPATATGRRVTIDASTTADSIVLAYPGTVAQLDELDGFSTTGGVIVKLSQPIDARGIDRLPDADPPVTDPVRDAEAFKQPDSPLLLVNVDPDSPEHGQAIGIVPRWFEQAKDDFFLFDEYTLLAQPAIPLRPRTRYALAVTDALLARDGTPVGPSEAMYEALTRSDEPYAIELRAAVEDLSTSVGIDAEHVVGATVFTTASVEDGMIEMAQQNRATPAPAAGAAWTVETPLTPPDTRARFRTTYPAPEYRKPKPDGKWQLDAEGRPIVQKVEQLEVFLAFSDAEQSGPRPVVIYGHGLGGDKDGCWGTAERLAEVHPSGVAVLAIDSPEHGSRTEGETTLISSVYGFFGIDPETSEFDIGRARDNFRQMASDQLELVRFISTLGSLDLLPVGAPDGVPDLDVSRILYIGHSFGGVQGPNVMAIAPEITQATWNVGGAGLMMLLRDSPTFGIVVKGLTPSGTPFGAVARFMAISQAIVDPGDPLNFARYATLEPLTGVEGWASRDVLLQEVVADKIVPNSSTEALARAAGLELVHPVEPPSGIALTQAPVTGNLASGATGVIAQFDKMEGDKTANHGELIFAPEARAQYVEFFQSGLASEHATVVAPY